MSGQSMDRTGELLVPHWQCDACFEELPESLLESSDRFPKCPHCGWCVWRPEDLAWMRKEAVTQEAE